MYQELGFGDNGAAPVVDVEQVAAQARRARVMRTALAGIGGLAGGMVTAVVLRPEDVGEERAKTAVKGGAIGGAVALALFLGFQGLIAGVEAVAPEPTTA
jgi:hypothetical protein